jgi:hypothetical protein
MLSIQIPTVDRRSHVFEPLYYELKRQAAPFGNDIEILYLSDDGTMPLARKRSLLYEMSTKPYSVQWDDDDWIHPLGIFNIMKGVVKQPDCICYRMISEFQGRAEYRETGYLRVTDFRRRYKVLMKKTESPHLPYDECHPPSNKCVIRTDLARKAANSINPNQRYGEDGDFAKEVVKSLKTEYYIDMGLYWYLNTSGDAWGPQRYGLPKNYIF